MAKQATCHEGFVYDQWPMLSGLPGHYFLNASSPRREVQLLLPYFTDGSSEGFSQGPWCGDLGQSSHSVPQRDPNRA